MIKNWLNFINLRNSIYNIFLFYRFYEKTTFQKYSEIHSQRKGTGAPGSLRFGKTKTSKANGLGLKKDLKKVTPATFKAVEKKTENKEERNQEFRY